MNTDRFKFRVWDVLGKKYCNTEWIMEKLFKIMVVLMLAEALWKLIQEAWRE